MLSTRLLFLVNARFAFALLILLSASSFADIDNKKLIEFKSHYADFGTLFQNGDFAKANKHGKKAYALSLDLWGNANGNTATVAYDYATSLLGARKTIKATSIFNKAFEIYQNIYSVKSEKLITVALDFAKIIPKESTAYKGYLEQAVEISSAIHGHSSFEHASMLSQTGSIYLNKNNYADGLDNFEKSVDIIASLNLEDITILTQALVTLGQSRKQNGDYKKAAVALEKAATLMTKANRQEDPIYTITIKSLISTYQSLNSTVLFRERLQELGRITARNKGNKHLPLYKVAAKYPNAAIKNHVAGFVTVMYDINEFGETKNHRIKESNSPLFHSSAINAAKQFIYIPRYKNEEFVTVKNVINKFIFNLAD